MRKLALAGVAIISLFSPSCSPGTATEEPPAASAAHRIDGSTLTGTGAATGPGATGTIATQATTPIARAYSLMTDAPGRGVLLFGGQFGTPPGTSLSDVWSLSLTGKWTELDDASGRGSDAIAYDTDAELVVLVEESATWTYDSVEGVWGELKTTGHPHDVWGARIAYDSGSDRTILFGGFNGSLLNDQTWALDLEARTWTKMHPATSPPAQNFHAMAYDPVADRVVVFGTSFHEGIWAYDYDADAWTDVSQEAAPSARDYSAMVFDPAGKRLILFGGVTGPSEEPLGDTWAFDTGRNAWIELTPDASPSPRGWHAMASDAETGAIFLFSGGETRDTDRDDVWLFDSRAQRWTEIATSP